MGHAVLSIWFGNQQLSQSIKVGLRCRRSSITKRSAFVQTQLLFANVTTSQSILVLKYSGHLFQRVNKDDVILLRISFGNS